MYLEGDIARSVGRVLRDVLEECFGGAIIEALNFQFKRETSLDMFVALWEDPHLFYEGLREILGDGTDVVLKMFAEKIRGDFEKLIKLMKSGNEGSKEKLRGYLGRRLNETLMERDYA